MCRSLGLNYLPAPARNAKNWPELYLQFDGNPSSPLELTNAYSVNQRVTPPFAYILLIRRIRSIGQSTHLGTVKQHGAFKMFKIARGIVTDLAL